MRALHQEDEPIATASADVADPEALRHAVAALQERHGPVRDAILCAGTVLPGYFTELPADTFRDQMEVNYFGIVNAVRLVVPGMIERREGTITCVSSTAGVIGVLGYSAYAPSKFAVRGLCDSFRMESKPHGIHVAGVYPADVDTPQLAFEKPFKPKELVALSGSVEPMSPERVAANLIRGVERRKAVIRPGLTIRLLCAAAAPLLISGLGAIASAAELPCYRLNSAQGQALGEVCGTAIRNNKGIIDFQWRIDAAAGANVEFWARTDQIVVRRFYDLFGGLEAKRSIDIRVCRDGSCGAWVPVKVENR